MSQLEEKRKGMKKKKENREKGKEKIDK